MARKVTGIDIGAKAVSVVEAVVAGRTIKIINIKQLPVVDNNPEATLADAVRQKKIDKKNIFCGLPVERIFYRELNLPFTDKKKIEHTLPFTLSDTLPFPVEASVYSIYPPGQEENRSNIIALVTKKETMDSFMELFGAASLNPSVITAESAASALAVTPPDPEISSFVSLDISANRMTINFIDGKKSLFSRTINSGVENMALALSDKLQISADEATRILVGERQAANDISAVTDMIFRPITRQIELSIRSFKKDHTPGPVIVVSGLGRKIQALLRRIEKDTGIQTSQASLNAAPQFENGADEETLMDSAIAAYGYILTGLEGSNINFIRKKSALIDTPFFGLLYSQRRTAMVGAVLLLALYTLGLTMNVSRLREDKERVKENITSLFKKTLPDVNKIVDEKRQLKVALNAIEEKFSIMSETDVRSVDVLKEISTRAPADLSFRVVRLRIGTDSVKLDGETGNFDSVEKIKSGLSQAGIFESVDVGGAKASRLQDIVEFKLNLKIKEH